MFLKINTDILSLLYFKTLFYSWKLVKIISLIKEKLLKFTN